MQILKFTKLFSSLAIVTIGMSGLRPLSTTVHADDGNYPKIIKHWNWQTSIAHDPNQYWEMYQNKPVIQKLNDKREITYYIDAWPSNKYYRAWKYAVDQYNKLNVIKLVPTIKPQAQIKLMGKFNWEKAEDLSSFDAKPDLNGDSGITYNNFTDSTDNHAYFTNSVCVLSTAIGMYNDMSFFKLIAEHELGHALGFAHNNNRINGRLTMMNNGYDFINVSNKKHPRSLGAYEKQQLIDHYGPNPNDLNQKVTNYNQ